MINMDMIGRMKDNKLIVGGVGTAEQWRKWLNFANIEGSTVITTKQVSPDNLSTNFALQLPQHFYLSTNEDGYGPSDHSSFYAKKIPVLFFFTGTHDDYHKPSDTADKINYEDEARVVTFIGAILISLVKERGQLTYTTAKSDSPGGVMSFRVYLGTIPNYAD